MKSKFFIINAVIFACYLIGIKNIIAQDNVVVILSQKVGETIDSTEKVQYGLFPFYKKEDFQSAQFLQMPDSSIVLKAVMKDGSIKNRPFTKEQFLWTKKIAGGNVSGKNSEKETRTHRIFGIGLRVYQWWYDELAQLLPPSSTITISITPHRNFRIEPEIGYFSTKSYSQTLEENLTDKNFHIGLGIYPMLQKGNTNLYFGIRWAQIKITDEYVEYIVPTGPPWTYTYKKEELISKHQLIGPVIGGEYLFAKHFSLGGEVGLKYAIYHSDVEGKDPNHNHDEDKTKSILTESNLFVRFYF